MLQSQLKLGVILSAIAKAGKNIKNAALQCSTNRLKEKHSNAIILDTEEMCVPKMSEIILEYADILLDKAYTRLEKEKAIMIAVAAWNLSLLEKHERKKELDTLLLQQLELDKNSDDYQDAHDTFQILINKKLIEYPSIDRFIVDYEFIKLDRDNYHLNVASTYEPSSK